MSVIQSGQVTPGHFATWTTDGIIQDGGPIAAAQKVLGRALNSNFNTTFDQPILINPAITAFQLTGIIVTNASISLTTVQGGFYTAASKGGSVIVLSTQAYSALTNKNLLMQPTLTAFAQAARFSSTNLGTFSTSGSLTIYLSLTTTQGAAATADVYLVGMDLTA